MSTVPVEASDAISVSELLDREAQGSPGENLVVAGFVFDDGTGMRICEALAESFPPQCGGRSIALRNEIELEVELQTEQGVRWTDTAVWLVGWVDGDEFVVT